MGNRSAEPKGHRTEDFGLMQEALRPVAMSMAGLDDGQWRSGPWMELSWMYGE